MKSKIVLFLGVLLLTVIGIKAQPRCREPFNPFYICFSNFQHSDYLFYGEVVSSERLEDASSGIYDKSVVKVEKNFKGNLPKEITLYFGHGFTCGIRRTNNNFRDSQSGNGAQKAGNKSSKNTFLFLVGASTLNGQKIYFAHQLSRPMSDYSEEAIKEVFTDIESVMSNQKKDFVEGSVFEQLLKVRQVSLNDQDFDRLSVNSESNQPLANILIEATSKKDGKVYRARSKADGTFRIDNIPNGIYKIKLHLPPGKQQSEPFTYGVDKSSCSRKWYIPVMP
jgi:hypothetical protein